jgi:hypothetical protein
LEDEVARARRRGHDVLRLALDDSAFAKGLLTSSTSLFDQKSALQSSIDRKTERGLTKYVSRASMKATPFATFCTILPSRFESNRPAPVTLSSGRLSPESLVRLNKSLYDLLVQRLLQRPFVRRSLELELNPTVRELDTHFVFLVGTRRTETFRRVGRNPALSFLCDVLRKQGGALSMHRLVQHVVSAPEVNVSKEDATAYVEQLLQAGFFRIRTGVRAQDIDWAPRLRQTLGQIDDAGSCRVAELLRTLDELSARYVNEGVGKRQHVLDAMKEHIEATFVDLAHLRELREAPVQAPSEETDSTQGPPGGDGAAPSAGTAESQEQASGGQASAREQEAVPSNAIPSSLSVLNPIYEDCTAPATVAIDESATASVRRALRSYVHYTRRMSWARTEQRTMRAFFDDFYSPEDRPVSLLTFYEDYHREHLKPHLKRTRQRSMMHVGTPYDAANPFGTAFTKRVQHARQQMKQLLIAKWGEAPEAEELEVTPADLRGVVAGVPGVEPFGSVSFFGQFVDEPDHAGSRFILKHGRYSQGFGKYYSRFLDLFPEEHLAAIQKRNAHLTNQHLAEISADQSFNANLHPPLLPQTIAYPTGHSAEGEDPISVTSIVVEPARGSHLALQLTHRETGRRIYPIDLGFLADSLQPPLYKLMKRFSPIGTFSLPLPTRRGYLLERVDRGRGVRRSPSFEGPLRPADETVTVAEPVIYRPRIVYDGTLVLARRTWTVPPSAVPHRTSGESVAAYLERVGAWRRRHQIPRKVYVKAKSAGGEAQRPGRDDSHKPQYVDFADPLLTEVFARIWTQMEHPILTIEERYPTEEMLPSFDGQRYTTEHVLQIDYPANSGSPAGTSSTNVVPFDRQEAEVP